MSVILYNYRYRGPFEYEKFVLNTYQIRNDIKAAIKKFREGEAGDLVAQIEELDLLLNNKLGSAKDGRDGKLQQLLELKQQIEGVET